MKKIFRFFLQGLLFVAPAGLTIFILYWVFDKIDGPLRNYFDSIFHVQIPGIGLLITFTVITLLGWIGQSILFRPIGKFVDKVFEKAPIVKMLYSALTDFFNAFVGEKKKFTRPVLVKVNMVSELEKVGFITSEDLSELGVKDKVAVLFPHSYNWSGEMFIVPKEHIKPLNIPPGEVMKFALTGGVTRV
ncbi:MAG: DUF502 domain-containing protein [Bacteroidales bacterium]|nr:DUF502 domain-containing protein [Bacteroidales bacterium]MBN2762897.1 DUF502 domain-containing protein [Bacteroidales bacterium]